jgi:hypothetical protein
VCDDDCVRQLLESGRFHQELLYHFDVIPDCGRLQRQCAGPLHCQVRVINLKTYLSIFMQINYFSSKEYRSKFNQQFPWLTRFFKKINVAASQPQSLFTTNANNIMRTTSTIRASQLFIRRRGNEQTINDS